MNHDETQADKEIPRQRRDRARSEDLAAHGQIAVEVDTMTPAYAEIALELRRSGRWVAWRLEDVKDRKRCKVPKHAVNPFKNASSTDPATWSSYEDALINLNRHKPAAEYVSDPCPTGLGLVLGEPFIGVDLDLCLDNGALTAVAKQFLQKFPPTYTELSPSQKGLHFWYKGKSKKDGLRTDTAEVYARGRYLTMTGWRLPDTPEEVTPIDEDVVRAIFDWVDAQRPVKAKNTTSTNSRINNEKFKLLMAGDYTGAGFGDISAAVQSLLTYLAHHHNLDMNKVDEDFRKSGLYKDHPGKSNWIEKYDRLKTSELAKAREQAASWIERDAARPKGQSNPRDNWRTRVKSTLLSTVEPAVLEWLWPDRVPLGNVTIFAGDPGIGKSLMTLDLVGRGSIGQEFLDGKPNTIGAWKSILMADEDDRATILVPRLMALGADLAKIQTLDMIEYVDDDDQVQDSRMVNLEQDIAALRAMIKEDEQIKMIMIDPISNYLGNKSMFKDQEFRSVMMPLVELAQSTGVAIITVMHNSKQTGRSALQKVGASLGGVGTARIGWTFIETDEEGEREMMIMKKNLGNFPGLRYCTEGLPVNIGSSTTEQAVMKYVGVAKGTADNAIAAREDTANRMIDKAIVLLKKLLPIGAEVKREVVTAAADVLGINERTLRRAMQELGIVGKGSKKFGITYSISGPASNSFGQSDRDTDDTPTMF